MILKLFDKELAVF